MDALVTKGKTSAELGYAPPDPRTFIPLIEHELGLAADLLGIVTGTALAGGVLWLVERIKQR